MTALCAVLAAPHHWASVHKAPAAQPTLRWAGAAPARSACPIVGLPDEVLVQILGSLEGAGLSAVACVSREFRDVVAANPQLYTVALRADFGAEPDAGAEPRAAYRQAYVQALVDELSRQHELYCSLRVQEADLQDLLSHSLSVRKTLLGTPFAAGVMQALVHIEQDSNARLTAASADLQAADRQMKALQSRLARVLCSTSACC